MKEKKKTNRLDSCKHAALSFIFVVCSYCDFNCRTFFLFVAVVSFSVRVSPLWSSQQLGDAQRCRAGQRH